jgi:hypothetical protein
MNTQYFHHICYPFLMPSPFPLVPIPGQDLFYLSVFHFFKNAFLFVYDGHRVFHCDISIYVCIIPRIVSSLCFSPFYFSHLTMISTGLSVPYSYLYRKYITIVTFFTFFIKTTFYACIVFFVKLSCIS